MTKKPEVSHIVVKLLEVTEAFKDVSFSADFISLCFFTNKS